MKRLLCLALCLILLPLAALAEEPASFFEDAEANKIGRITRTYDSPTLKFAMDRFLYDKEICYLTRVWVQEPARQIRKATSDWHKNVQAPSQIVKKVEGAALAINGSGFVSPLYPWIPENYPGKNKDYYYTPLGSLTVTDGEVFRNLEGVAYYGLTLDENGLQMYVDADNEEVLATVPLQTWSFYVGCPMLRDNEDILPVEWDFADQRAARTIIGRVDRHNYLILTVTKDRGKGISLRSASSFFRERFRTEWVYDLDGGPSYALMVRKKRDGKLAKFSMGGARIVDIMAFTE
jgi:hypothetical protein